jgi:hypothetical protein
MFQVATEEHFGQHREACAAEAPWECSGKVGTDRQAPDAQATPQLTRIQ